MIDYFFTYDIKNYFLSFVNSFIFDIVRRIKTFSELCLQKDVTSEI